MKLPSLTKEVSWVWSEDPALDAPPPDAPDDVRKEWDRRLDVARDTGQWDGVTKAGAKLTLFSIRIVPELAWRRLMDSLGDGGNIANALAVRLALTSVSNLDDFDGRPFKIELRHVDGYGQIATPDVLDLLGAYLRHARSLNQKARDPIEEMATAIARRQTGMRPLS